MARNISQKKAKVSLKRKMGGEIKDERMKVIVVDSVKGGCGKTTISLKYATMLAKNNSKVCYIDLDILGSSIETFITGKKFEGKSSERDEREDGDSSSPFKLDVDRPARFYLNEMFKGKEFGALFLNKIKVTESDTSAIFYFDLIACNPDQDEKDLFKPSKLMNYVGQIDYEYFAALIEKMLKKLEKREYTHIIIDMPPNSDAYTDSIFNILLRADETGKKKIKNLENADPNEMEIYNITTKYNVEICMINSLDRAHFEANLAWLKAMINERRMEWALNSKLNFKIVFNNNSGIEDEDMIKNYLRNRLRQLNELLIKKMTRFDYDRTLAINAMNDYNIGFESLKESEIK